MSKPKTIYFGPLVLLGLCLTCTASSRGQHQQPLKLVQTIPMPNVKGRIDHMDVDVKGKRLFVAGLENGSLEIVDLDAGSSLTCRLSMRGFMLSFTWKFLPMLR